MSRPEPDTDYTKDIILYLEVVTHNRRGRRFRDGMARIKLTDPAGRYIQWVNDSQAAMLEQQYPGVVVWR